MRLTILLFALAGPAAAWEFTPGAICVLEHEASETSVRLTFDPDEVLYTIAVSLDEPWIESPIFAMRFDGNRPIFIQTDRYALTDEQRTLNVADSGFGNVLDGLQFNARATAILGDQSASVSLEDAAEPVAAFRACADAGTA